MRIEGLKGPKFDYRPMHPETFILRFAPYILFIALSGCIKTVGNSENKEFHQDIIFSKTDSLTIDSLMAYCYHSGSRYKGVWVMQGTAFYLSYKQRVYLFSALHNFTGIDPETNKILNSVAGRPKDLEVWQFFQDRNDDWIKYYNSAVKDSLLYSILVDSLRAYQKSADAGKDYKLYRNKNPLFYGGKTKNEAGYYYDVGGLDVNDSFQKPRHILDFHKYLNSEPMHVGDTLFYWGFSLQKDQPSWLQSLFVGKITNTPSANNPYITSNVFSRAGSSGSAVFKISNHKVFLIGVIARGNADKNIVYISPIKEAIRFLKLL
jgi:hypothetical protein